MPERHGDWLQQAQRDLDHAKLAIREGLILLEASDLPPRDRVPVYKPVEAPVPIDLTVCTQAELDREARAKSSFVVRILAESLVLRCHS